MSLKGLKWTHGILWEAVSNFPANSLYGSQKLCFSTLHHGHGLKFVGWLEASFKSMGLFVRSWFPMISFHLWWMFEVVFESEWRTTYFDLLRAKLIFSTSWHDKMSLTQMNQYRMFSFQTSTSPASMHRTWKVLYAKHSTPTKSHVELDDNSIVSRQKQSQLCDLFSTLVSILPRTTSDGPPKP